MEAEKLIQVVPSKRQLRHQQLEFYGFFHYSINNLYRQRVGRRNRVSPSVFTGASGCRAVGESHQGSRYEGSNFNL